MEGGQPVRVQKAIADRGLASRRQAEQWIREGRVTINGRTARLGDTCQPASDRIEIDGRRLPPRPPSRLILAVNKPRGYLCTNTDPHGGRTVFDLLPPDLRRQKLFCVGRLDKESEGLLLLTNDGDLQQRLAHPSYRVQRKYHVDLDRPLQRDDIPRLLRGIRWEGARLAVEKVFPRGRQGRADWAHLEVVLHHGRKREIRRLFYACGYEVLRLERVQIGLFRLGRLPKGGFRELQPREVRLLFAGKESEPR